MLIKTSEDFLSFEKSQKKKAANVGKRQKQRKMVVYHKINLPTRRHWSTASQTAVIESIFIELIFLYFP